MKREIIFDIPNDSEHRVLCQYGYDSYIKHNWYIHLQRKYYRKKWFFFGEEKWKWVTIDSGWSDKSIESMEQLNNSALKLYDENVLLLRRLDDKAMSL